MRSVLLKVEDAVMYNKIFDYHKPLFCLREALAKHKVSLTTADLGNEQDCEKIIVWDLNGPNRLYASECSVRGWQPKLILMLWEGPVVLNENWDLKYHQYFTKIFTWDDDYVDNQKYFKFYWPQTELPYYGIELPYAQKKLCTMIVSNKMYHHPQELYSERLKAISFFEKAVPEQFDLYGFGWNHSFKSYRGTVTSKEAVYARYKFAVCYENTNHVNGGITEKIFDCFRGGCVPIYLGADNVSTYIPPDTFIDYRNFSSYEELLDFLVSMDEQCYNQYVANIAAYARSCKFRLFGIDNFVSIMLKHLI